MMGVGLGGGGRGVGILVKVAVGGSGAAVGVSVAGDGAAGVLVGGGEVNVGEGVNVTTSAGMVGLGVISTMAGGSSPEGNSCIASNRAATTVSTTIINVPMAIATRCQGEVEPFPLSEGSKDTWLPSFQCKSNESEFRSRGGISTSCHGSSNCSQIGKRKWKVEP